MHTHLTVQIAFYNETTEYVYAGKVTNRIAKVFAEKVEQKADRSRRQRENDAY